MITDKNNFSRTSASSNSPASGSKEMCRAIVQLWDQWVQAGKLDDIQAEFGAFRSERERQIFESGWKVGAIHLLVAVVAQSMP